MNIPPPPLEIIWGLAGALAIAWVVQIALNSF